MAVGSGNTQYPIAEVGVEALSAIIDGKFEKLLSNSVLIHQRCAVIDVLHGANGDFEVNFKNPSNEIRLDFDQVVIATGRAGFAATDDILERLGVQRSLPQISIGIRLEMPGQFLKPLYDAHKDFKYAEFHDGYKVKSFCFSNYENRGGRLKYCHYQDQFNREVIFLDGYSNLSPTTESGNSRSKDNFALLLQLPPSFDRKWLEQVFVKNYHNLSGGKPIFQSLSDFLELRRDSFDVSPSVQDCTEMDIASLLPKAAVAPLRSACVDIIKTISSTNEDNVEKILRSAVIVAPEVEFFWSTVNVSKCFETNVPGLYVVGDAAGVARGNLQAAICGLAAANDIIEGYE